MSHFGPEWLHPLRAFVLAIGSLAASHPALSGSLRGKVRHTADLSLRISSQMLRPPARALLRSADSVKSWDWLWQPTYGRFWHDRFYRDRVDPYGCTVNQYDRHKYDRSLDLLDGRQFGSALEIGCSEGVFSEMIAPRCAELLAVDISDQAVERATARLSRLDHVSVARATLPMDMPPGPYDLILCLDVLYYLPKDMLIRFLPRLKAALRPGGVLFTLHYLGDFGQAMRGREVHDLLVAALGLEVEHDQTVPDVGPKGAGYRVTCLVKPPG
ncbi:methyltransferase [Mycobacterium sp. KBS0706]|uniref:class I SAM-dependent DNA methyltransferase n=1 Tax=Mycobacterium sp. KBS0706 TaxID=2578109 RepID=UPI00110F9D01|nr:SAM-dependent methyltransferase [Mycobacterium sp. KBS0706]TSD83075.1 methyltransferase [Mycobacterium sp. KBS0706]